MVTKNIKLPDNLENHIQCTYYQRCRKFSDFFNPGAEKLHQSAGISIMLAMNQNFVIAIDIGKAFNKQDGNIGFSIGLNYLF